MKKKMSAKKNNVRVLKALFIFALVTAICISVLLMSVSAKEKADDPRGVKTVMLDSLLSDRHYVIDTFTGTGTTYDNPAAREYGYIGKYMFEDIIENYQNSAVLRDCVFAYNYILQNPEKLLEELLTELVSYIADLVTDDARSNFIAGAKNKSYDSLLSSIFTSDYQSESGMTLGSELSSYADLKAMQKRVKSLKEKLEFTADLNDFVSDANSVVQLQYLYDFLPAYALSMDDYLDSLKNFYSDEVNFDGLTKDELMNYFQLLGVEIFQYEDEALAKWKTSVDVELFCSNTSDIYKNFIKTGVESYLGTLSNVILYEKMAEEGQDLADTLTRTKAESGDDAGYRRVVNKYIRLIDKSDVLTDSEKKEIFLAWLESVKDAAIGYGQKYIGKKLDLTTITKNVCVEQMNNVGLADAATYFDLYRSVKSLATTMNFTTFVLNNITGIDQVCEKIIDLQFLDNIRNYTIDTFDSDLAAYNSIKNACHTEEDYALLEELAGNVIDDLMLLKRITLQGEDIAYSMISVFTDSIVGELIQNLTNQQWSENAEQMKTIATNTLVDTLIDPIARAPLSLSGDETVEIIKTNDYLTIKITRGDEIEYINHLADDYLNAGIDANNAHILINNTSDTPLYIKYIDFGSDITVTGTGDVNIGAVSKRSYGYGGYINNEGSANLNIISSFQAESTGLDFSGAINIGGDLITIDSTVSNYGELNICGDLISNYEYGYRSFYNYNVIKIEGDLDAGESGIVQPYSADENTSIYVKGNANFGNSSESAYVGNIIFNGTEQQEVSNLHGFNVDVLNPQGIKYLTDAEVRGRYDLHNNPLDCNGFCTSLFDESVLVDDGWYGDVCLIGTRLSGNYTFDSITMFADGFKDAIFEETATVNVNGDVTVYWGPFYNYGEFSADNIYIHESGSFSGECIVNGSVHLNGNNTNFSVGGNSEIKGSVYLNYENSGFTCDGTVTICGDLIAESGAEGNYYHQAYNYGDLTVMGDICLGSGSFTQYSEGASLTVKGDADFGEGSYLDGTVIFAGTARQKIRNLNANNVEVTNPEGIEYQTDIEIRGKYDLHDNPLVHNGFITNLYDATLVTETNYGHVCIYGNVSFPSDCTFDELEIFSDCTVDQSENITVLGDLTVHSYRLYNYGAITVLGNIIIENGIINNESGTVNVFGDVTITGYDGHIYNYGAFNIGGDLTATENDNYYYYSYVENNADMTVSGHIDFVKGYFVQYGEETSLTVSGDADFGEGSYLDGTVIFAGTARQKIRNLNANNVEVTNPEGIEYQTDIEIRGKYDLHDNPLIHNGFITTLYGATLVTETNYGFVSASNVTFDGAYTFDTLETCSCNISENGDVTVLGNLIAVDGDLENNGVLTVLGNVEIQNAVINNYSGNISVDGDAVITGYYGSIYNEASFSVGGNLKTSTEINYNNGYQFENRGTVAVGENIGFAGGRFVQSAETASVSVKGKVDFGSDEFQHGTIVFNGTTQQEIQNLYVENIEVTNPEGVVYLSNIEINGRYDLHGNPLEHNGFITYLYNGELISDVNYGYVCAWNTVFDSKYTFDELELYDSCTIGENGDVTVLADLTVSGSSQNSGNLTVIGNFILDNGTFYNKAGTISVIGDVVIKHYQGEFYNEAVLNICGNLYTDIEYDYYYSCKVENSGVITVGGNVDFTNGAYYQIGEASSISVKGDAEFGEYTNSEGTIIFDGTKKQSVKHLYAYNVEVTNSEGILYLTDAEISGRYNLNGNPLDCGEYFTYLVSENACTSSNGNYGKVSVSYDNIRIKEDTIWTFAEVCGNCFIDSGVTLTVLEDVEFYGGTLENNGEMAVGGSVKFMGDNAVLKNNASVLVDGNIESEVENFGYYWYYAAQLENRGVITVNGNFKTNSFEQYKNDTGTPASIYIKGDADFGELRSENLTGNVIFFGTKQQLVSNLHTGNIEISNIKGISLLTDTYASSISLDNDSSISCNANDIYELYNVYSNGYDLIVYGRLNVTNSVNDGGIVISVECGKATVHTKAGKYSMDGEKWQSSNTFENLGDHTYTVYIDGTEKNIQFIGHSHRWVSTGDYEICTLCSETRDDTVYTVTFVNYDNKTISSSEYRYGDNVIVPADPAREADKIYTYAFNGWNSTVTTVKGNVTYKATYKLSYIDYTVRFVDYDGTLISEELYHYGNTVQTPDSPSREADETFTYSFSGWDKTVTLVTADTTYTATYKSTYINYTVRFVDYDGEEISSFTYHYQDNVTIPDDPEKPSDNTFAYVFVGWDKEVTPVKGDETYTAVYEPVYIEYTVKFIDYDNTIISEKTYHYDDTVILPDDPVRQPDNIYSYEFIKWSPEINTVKGNATYKATYESAYIEYTVRFVDYDGTLISENVYHYGDTVVLPDNPTREKDDEYTYTFAGWDKEVKACTGNETYTAEYTTDENVYTIIFRNYDGKAINTSIYHYGEEVTVPEAPAKPSDETYYYVFTGWDKEVVNVVDNAEYTAVFEAREHEWDEPTYEWSEDHLTVTAKRTSKNDDTVFRTETVNAVTETVDAGCETDGKTTYTASFESAEFETQIYEETIPATGHIWTFTGFEWTKTDDGYTVSSNYKCGVCGNTESIEASVSSNTIDAGCEEDGETIYIASVKAIDAPDGKSHMEEKKEKIEAKGHKWTYTGITFTEIENGYAACANYVCDECEKNEIINAEVTVSTSAASCEEPGEKVYTASVDAENSLDKTAHIDTKTVAVEQVGHAWKFDGFEWTKTDDGYTAQAKFKCERCEAENMIDAIVSGQTTSASCAEDGIATFTAMVDENVSPDENEHKETKTEITEKAKGHLQADPVKENENAPTCTEDGNYDIVVYCSVCHIELSREKITVDKLGHEWDEGTVKKPATCTEDGEMTYTCKHDNTHTYTEPIKATGHEYEAVATPPTCTERGYTTYTCKNCGDTYTDGYTDALGHEWDEGTVKKPATCTEDGEMTYTCKHDNTHTYTEPIKATGHEYNGPEWIWDNEEAKAKFVCNVCKDESIIKADVTKAEDKGVITYVAKALFEEKEYTYEKTEYIEYTVIFKDSDGTVLSEKTYHYGKTPEIPDAPTRENDTEYSYTFKGWDKDVTPVTEETVYTATYIKETILPQFVLGDVNGDGTTNNKDVVTLFRYVSGGADDVNVIALDINGDGSVNNKDVVTLFKYLSSGSVVISDKPYTQNIKLIAVFALPNKTKVK